MVDVLRINYALEGRADVGFAQVLIRETGHTPYLQFVKRGVTNLDNKIPDYRKAAELDSSVGWLVLRDGDGNCPVDLRRRFDDGDRVATFALRVANTMAEAWLFADKEAAADYFRIAGKKIPSDPESLAHPKRHLLQLCASHSPTEIRNDMVSRGGNMGPLFADRLNEFSVSHWRLDVAERYSESLRRAADHLRSFPTDPQQY
ncbi:hypothetical protein [uncultured Corynebacterium sp.]|uniref:hypothetical protein n=1 Tax=uncultured Corynebacterium sp. TaxID=159447 RepID=UPI0025929471|nr:hypothetical protein [uncultured Corynebacterium sp.]